MSVIKQVERSAMHRVVGWMKEIIKAEKFPFEIDADIELLSFGVKRNFPDILIFSKYNTEVACLIEFKPPFPYDPYDPELVMHTYDEANRAPGNFNGSCRYFGTWNLNKFVLWDKKEYNADSFLDMIYKPYDVAEARTINDITRVVVEESVKKFLKKFLKEFYEAYFEIKPIPALHIDERFIFRLRTAIDTFSVPISEKIYEKAKKNPKLKREIRKWYSVQGWLFQDKLDDYDRTARQYIYLIVDKVLFYNALRIHKKKLKEIQLDRNLSAAEFKKQLQEYFNEVLKIDYEPIFSENFLETLPLPNSIIGQIVSFIDSLNHKYNFSNLGYEIIGRVFEGLIPGSERHQLGQYYTRSDVVDLINSFCLKKKDNVVLDPGCGAATFLIRAYSLILEKNKSKSHREILRQLYGIDISKFAAHLSMINLSIKGLSETENYPHVVNNDFFDIFPEQIVKRKYKIKKLSGELAEIKIPHVDAVIGNPPYTRQEEMDSAFEERYKEKLNSAIKKDFNFKIGKRSGIYSYFFIHGSIFLKDGGMFGFITSNSWLDTDYGKYLQEFFLIHYKIVAIIGSKVERWFEDADINTCITILERCKNEEKKDNNKVKFVQLKVPLINFIPLSMSESERWEKINKLKRKILDQNEYYEDDEIRIYPKNQKELFSEGFDDDEKKYIGSKWGKYIRAAKIYFKILDLGKELFVPLETIAKIRRGYTSGANDFFYLKNSYLHELSIEEEFWTQKSGKKVIENFVMVSPKESKGINLKQNDIKKRVLLIHNDRSELKDTNILKYIKLGEEKGFSTRPTCASRANWYELPHRKPGKVLWQMIHFTRHVSFYNESNVYVDHNLFELLELDEPKLYCAMLNSTLYALIKEINGRVNLGQGSVKNEGLDIKMLPIIPLEKWDKESKSKLSSLFEQMKERQVGSILDEIGATKPEDVNFNKVKKDRFQLDRIIFDKLGLNKDERLEVYKSVVDMVKSRIDKARSVKKKAKKSKVDPEKFAENVLEETCIKELKKFPHAYLNDVESFEKKIPEGELIEVANDLFNGPHLRIDDEIVKCRSEIEARFIEYAIFNGSNTVQIPKKKVDLIRIFNKYDDLVKKIKTKSNRILIDEVKNKKLREKIIKEIDKKIFGR